MSKQLYAVLDFESSGLNPNVDQVIEIGCIITDLESILGTFNTFVKLREGITLSDFIKNYTGITENETEAGMHERKAFDALVNFIEMRGTKEQPVIVVAQFAPFDFSFLNEHKYAPMKFICTRAMSRLLDPTLSASLKDVYPRLTGKPIVNQHTAVGDCMSTLEVFTIQKRRAEEAGIDYINIVNDAPDRPLSFVPYYSTVVTI